MSSNVLPSTEDGLSLTDGRLVEEINTSRVTLSCCWKPTGNDGLGYAVLLPEIEMVEVGCFKEFESFLGLQQLKEELQPTTIFIPGGSDQKFQKSIKKPLENKQTPTVITLSESDFQPRSAYFGLSNTFNITESDAELYLCKVVGGSTPPPCLASALGGLLMSLKDPIKGITYKRNSNRMCIDPNTLEALQIFKKVSHPSAHHGIGSSKEGLSVFGIVNVCKTKMGSTILRQWMLSPTRSRSLIEERLHAIDLLIAPHHGELLSSLRDHLRFIKDPKDLIAKFREKPTVKNWQSLFQLLYSFPVIVDICNKLSEGRQNIFGTVVDSFQEEEISSLFKRIHDTVDMPMSQKAGRIVIKWGVNSEVDRHKDAYDGLGAFLDGIAARVRSSLPPGFSYPLTVDYYPQLGYFTTVGVAYFNDQFKTDFPQEDFTFQFKSDEKLFYKSSLMRELDEKYGDIYSAIMDLEAEVERSLIEVILDKANTDALLGVSTVGRVDCIAALSLVSKEERWTRPNVVEENVLHVIDGRHPLMEKVVERFIPNDVVNPGGKRLTIITGANNSGKSVFLKQIGIIVYLAHIGCYVPAKEAVVGLTDRVFSRMKSSTPQEDDKTSAFASDLRDVDDMVKYATDRSLLIIDEFGKGTVASDGIALLASVINFFLNKTNSCPRIFISTHFTEIFTRSLIDVRHEYLNLVHMSVDVDETDVENLIFRFKIASGTSTNSHAFFCARKSGVPESTVSRAKYILALLKKRVPASAFRRLLVSGGDATARHKKVLKLLSMNINNYEVTKLREEIRKA